ncbi:MAG: hypothetical protein M1821_005375 [Bathelium mastoideum]|nr:MAG: hypothetical protein M1821_005375 [Bathelium mastoideum]
MAELPLRAKLRDNGALRQEAGAKSRHSAAPPCSLDGMSIAEGSSIAMHSREAEVVRQGETYRTLDGWVELGKGHSYAFFCDTAETGYCWAPWQRRSAQAMPPLEPSRLQGSEEDATKKVLGLDR